MTQQNRLQSGGRIDRSKPMTFTYNGKQFTGFQGRHSGICHAGKRH